MRRSLFVVACFASALMVLAMYLLGMAQETKAPAKKAPAKREVSPALKPIEDKAGLPRVLLIGDSISIGYTLPVREMLAGVANVHRIPENGGPTSRGLERIDAWLGDKKWDLIHFNWGLHDLKAMSEGNIQVPLAEYETNLRKLVTRFKQTGAKLIWCSTTPVPDAELTPARKNNDVIAYNDVARKIMQAEGVAIDDLYSFALPKLKEIQREANVHFSDDGSRVLAEQVSRSIREALGK